MAAKKSIPKKSGAHASATRNNPRARHPRGPKPTAAGKSAPCSYRRARPDEPGTPAPGRDELLERLSSRLALVEAVALALRHFEPEPELGSICVALNQAIVLLGRAHEDVDLYLQKVQS